MAEEGADEANNLEALKRSMQYALIKNCDMNEEMRSDCVDAVISAAEKYVPRPSAARTRSGRRSRAGTRFVIFSTRRSRPAALSLVYTGTRQTMSLRREWSRRRYACALSLSLARAARSHARSARSWLVPPALPHLRADLSPSSLSSPQMDKKYNENWIVVIGQGFSFEVTHEVKHVLWMYFCDIAVLVYKAGARQVGT